MPKYIKQNDKFSCGAYAVFNTLQWQGKRVPLKIIPKIWKDSGQKEPNTGMSFENLEKALTKSKIKWQFKYCPSIKEVDTRLNNGEAMILAYYYEPHRVVIRLPYSKPIVIKMPEGHYALCIGKSGKRYIMVNDNKTKVICRHNRKRLKQMLHRRYVNSRCWFIKR